MADMWICLLVQPFFDKRMYIKAILQLERLLSCKKWHFLFKEWATTLMKVFSHCLHKRNRWKSATREQNYSLWCQEKREECESVLWSVSLLEIRWHLCTAHTRHCEVRAAARAVKNTFHLQFCPPTHNSQKHTHMYWQTLPNDIRVGTADLCFWTRALKSSLISITCLHYSSNLLWHSQLRPLRSDANTHTHGTEQRDVQKMQYHFCSQWE